MDRQTAYLLLASLLLMLTTSACCRDIYPFHRPSSMLVCPRHHVPLQTVRTYVADPDWLATADWTPEFNRLIRCNPFPRTDAISVNYSAVSRPHFRKPITDRFCPQCQANVVAWCAREDQRSHRHASPGSR